MNKDIIIPIVVILLAGAAYHFFTPDSWKFWEGNTATFQNTATTTATSTKTPPAHEAITAKHQFKAGKHILTGEVNLAAVCYSLTTNTQIAESYPEQVTINFITTKKPGDVCAQVISPAQFKVEFSASEKASIKATWNGEPVELKLVPVASDAPPLDFEIYKG